MNSKTLADLKSFLEISSLISLKCVNEEELLSVFMQEAMKIVNSENSVFIELNRFTNKLECRFAAGEALLKYKGRFLEKKSVALRCIECQHSINLMNVFGNVDLSYAKENLPDFKIDSMLSILIRDSEHTYGIAEFFNKIDSQAFTIDDLKAVELISGSLIAAFKNCEKFKALRAENERFTENSTEKPDYKFHNFVYSSPVVKNLLEEVKIVAHGNSTVLITGESGVGKELFAEQIYLNSSRKGKPFVRVNCASLSPTLIESELFGHVKGSFTNADFDRKGRFEVADGGVLFLDEIGELPLELQSKLLRAIQERKFEKVGSSKTISVDVRLIAATNKNLEKMVREGKFREDLFYRLNVYNLRIPPLAERPEDIDSLSEYFMRKYAEESNKRFKGFSDSAKHLLHYYTWPGNIRELENAVARAVIVGKENYISADDLRLQIEKIENSSDFARDSAENYASSDDKTLKSALDNFKKAYITRILKENNWNQTKTAKILDIQRTYVSRLMNELNIRDK